MKTYPQGSLLWPKEPIKLGRMSATPAQSFWVTNPEHSQQMDGIVKIARSGRNSGYAVNVSTADVEKFFTNGEPQTPPAATL